MVSLPDKVRLFQVPFIVPLERFTEDITTV
jgi:hypothetical protein